MPNGNGSPVGVTLPQETIDRLKANIPDIEQGRKELALLKKLGINVDALEEKLTWAATVNETLLAEVTPA